MPLKKYLPVVIFFVSFLIFNLNLSYETSGDVKAAELLPIALIKYHTLELDKFYQPNQSQYWLTIAPNTHKVVSSYPIIPGLLATPIFFIAKLAGYDITYHVELLSKLAASIIVVLAVVFMFLFLLELFDKRIAYWLTFIFTLATNVWSVASRGLWQHGPSLLFINLTLFFLLKGRNNQKFLPWSGLFIGLAIWNRPTNFLLLLPLVIYILVCYRKIFWKFCGLGIIPASLLILYSWKYFGTITSLGQAQNFNFIHPFFSGLAGLIFSPGHGILLFTPLFIFSLAAAVLVLFKKTEPLYKYLSIGIFLTLFLYAKWMMWWGGWSYGYRLLIELIPFLIILLGWFWKEYLQKILWGRILFFILLAFSLSTEILGAFFAPCRGLILPEDISAQEKAVWHIQAHPFFSCSNWDSLTDPGKRLDILYKKRFNDKAL